MNSINVKLEVFEGPFDLLFHLIEKNEIDIYDIPISTLTGQYLEYLDNIKTRDMENMSEFLLMAATLLEIKSKMLLPKPKKEEINEELDPRQELVERLLEYKKFKTVTDTFKKREEKASLIMYKESNNIISSFKDEHEYTIDDFMGGVTINDLFRAFEDVLKRKEMKVDRVRSEFKSVERDLYTIEEKINFIRDLLVLSPKINFMDIFTETAEKMEVVVTFLALLEMIKIKYVKIYQDKPFEQISITRYIGSDRNEFDGIGIYS